MAYPTIGVTYLEFIKRLQFEYGMGETLAELPAADLVFLQSALRDGLSRFYGAYPWSFFNLVGSMRIFDEIDCGDIYTTMTIAVGGSDSVVTISNPITASSGQLPFSIVGKVVSITKGVQGGGAVIKAITSCTASATSFSFANISGVTTGTLDECVISGLNSVVPATPTTQGTYDSPWYLQDRFERFASPFLTVTGPIENGFPYRLDIMTYLDYILAVTALSQAVPGKPQFVAVGEGGPYAITNPPITPGVEYTAPVEGDGFQRMTLYVFPAPDQDYILSYQYVPNPNVITASAIYPYGSALDTQAMVYACLAELDIRYHSASMMYEGRYQDALAKAILRDQRRGPKMIGYNQDSSDGYGPATNFGWNGYPGPYAPYTNPSSVVVPPTP